MLPLNILKESVLVKHENNDPVVLYIDKGNIISCHLKTAVVFFK